MKRVQKFIPYIIMLGSFFLRLYYVSVISVYKNQHDGGMPGGFGHLGYISYFVDNTSFPDFDVSQVDQFWHPPLHYFLTGKFLAFIWSIFPGQNGNYEMAQILPFVYVTASIIFIYKSLTVVFKENWQQNLALLFVAFQPSLIIRSATINNDALSTLLSVAFIYYLIRFVYSESVSYIILLMILFALGMWTKKNALLLVVPVGIVLLDMLIKDKKKTIFGSAIAFLAISPISFGWYIFLKIRWGIPFNFVWNLSSPDAAAGYIENVSVIKRLLDFSISHFKFQYVFVGNNVEAIDINPITVLIKSSVNELWTWTYYNDGIKKLSFILLLARIFITAILVLSVFLFSFDKRQNFRVRALIVSFLLFNILSFYIFAFKNPYICSMDYRYIEAVIICETILFGYLAGRNKFYKYALTWFTCGYVLTSALKIIVYGMQMFEQ